MEICNPPASPFRKGGIKERPFKGEGIKI